MMLYNSDYSVACPNADDHDPKEDESKETERKRDESVDEQRSEATDDKKQGRRTPKCQPSLSTTQHLVDEPVYDLLSILRVLISRHNNGLDVVIYLAGLHMYKVPSSRI